MEIVIRIGHSGLKKLRQIGNVKVVQFKEEKGQDGVLYQMTLINKTMMIFLGRRKSNMNTILSYLGYVLLAILVIGLGMFIFLWRYLRTYRYGNWCLSFEDRIDLIRKEYYE